MMMLLKKQYIRKMTLAVHFWLGMKCEKKIKNYDANFSCGTPLGNVKHALSGKDSSFYAPWAVSIGM